MSWDLLLRGAVLLAGLLLVVLTLSAAIRSFVLPRNQSVLLNGWLFQAVRWVFYGVATRTRTYGGRDRVLAMYAPVALVALPIFWLTLLSIAYTGVFWALHEGTWARCYRISASSLLTIGADEPSRGLVASALSYSEAALGLLLLTLLISYLPTIYQSFSRRELVVARLELRAGTPGSVTALLTWLQQAGCLTDNPELWQRWEEWFVEIEESHTSLPILSFFRSPQPGRSWVTAAGVILDASALLTSSVDLPGSAHRDACFKAGCMALDHVHRFFTEHMHTRPNPLLHNGHSPLTDEPRRADFEEARRQLADCGLPLRPDADAAWQQFIALRQHYHEALLFLAQLTVAPQAKALINT
ncbi:hypothetical protein [Hymenobacter jeollabukensis]|uniref:Two pore domain potassium channel family protein n=1 Tax=Hymenobacter jeollabukensis TaxID=2025313 RepID=A0A5R8WVH6_9BACT|nr:hypothetical protein [Hymenobacter jeollabukensis]TLM95416.1 hypothetical protein FDY95_06400 [Hymenobacter jeollabukensis]